MKGRLPQAFLDRTKRFGSGIIGLFVKLPRRREEVLILGRQMVRSGTSVPGHVREANRARSVAEFASKLGGACQEADETQLWLEYLREDCGIQAEQTSPLEQEASELLSIMAAMIRKCD